MMLDVLAAFWPVAALAVVLGIAVVTDLRNGKIYNQLTYPAMALGLIGHAFFGGLWGHELDPLGLVGALAGLAVGLLPLMAVSLAGGLGGGDAKLMGAIGAIGGWAFALSAMLYAFAAAVVLGLAILVHRRAVRQTFTRLGAAMVYVLAGRKPEMGERPESPTVPFGLALAVGSAAAGVEWWLTSPLAPRA